MNQYCVEKRMRPLYSFPESYILHIKKDLRHFQRRLQDGGFNESWGTEGADHQPSQGSDLKRKTRQVAQKYIYNNNEMTYFGWEIRLWNILDGCQRIDPLVVSSLYQTKHNYDRIGASTFNETDFSNTQSHLTTHSHTFGAEDGKATQEVFEVYIEEYHQFQGNRLSHIKYPFSAYDEDDDEIESVRLLKRG